MSTSGDAAEQVVRMSLEGVETVAKISGKGALELAKLLLAEMKKPQRTKGRASLMTMLKQGKEIKVFEIDDIMLCAEFHQLMPEELSDDYRKLLSNFVYMYQEPRIVRERFIQLQRILKNEINFREAQQLMRAEENAGRLRGLIGELEEYYTSDEWKRDFAADEAGQLPENLRRGVLSEDGIYDVLVLERELLVQMLEIVSEHIREGI